MTKTSLLERTVNCFSDKDIQKVAIKSGFSLENQDNGTYELDPRLYQFAKEIIIKAGAVSNALLINELVHRVSEINQDIQDTVSTITGD